MQFALSQIPMRASPAGYNLSHVLSDFVRSLDPASGRAVTSAYPMVTDAADKFFAPLEAARPPQTLVVLSAGCSEASFNPVAGRRL